LDFPPKTVLVYCGRFPDVAVLLVTATPFPRVTANAESVFRNLCCMASILRNDNFFRKSSYDYKNDIKQFPDDFCSQPYV